MRIVLMCPKCGLLRFADENNHSYDICEYCNTSAIRVVADEAEFDRATQEEIPMLRERVWRKFLYSNPQFDEETFERRLKGEREFREEIRRSVAKLPRCPTCNSTNIRHIGGGERAMSVIGLGLFSGKIGKNYECNNCKARW